MAFNNPVGEVKLGVVNYCDECGGSNVECPSYQTKPHYVRKPHD